jgi:hypothetical protein
MIDSETKAKLANDFVDFVSRSSKSELSDFLDYIQGSEIIKTPTGIVLASFICGYTFGLEMNKELPLHKKF